MLNPRQDNASAPGEQPTSTSQWSSDVPMPLIASHSKVPPHQDSRQRFSPPRPVEQDAIPADRQLHYELATNLFGQDTIIDSHSAQISDQTLSSSSTASFQRSIVDSNGATVPSDKLLSDHSTPMCDSTSTLLNTARSIDVSLQVDANCSKSETDQTLSSPTRHPAPHNDVEQQQPPSKQHQQQHRQQQQQQQQHTTQLMETTATSENNKPFPSVPSIPSPSSSPPLHKNTSEYCKISAPSLTSYIAQFKIPESLRPAFREVLCTPPNPDIKLKKKSVRFTQTLRSSSPPSSVSKGKRVASSSLVESNSIVLPEKKDPEDKMAELMELKQIKIRQDDLFHVKEQISQISQNLEEKDSLLDEVRAERKSLQSELNRYIAMVKQVQNDLELATQAESQLGKEREQLSSQLTQVRDTDYKILKEEVDLLRAKKGIRPLPTLEQEQAVNMGRYLEQRRGQWRQDGVAASDSGNGNGNGNGGGSSGSGGGEGSSSSSAAISPFKEVTSSLAPSAAASTSASSSSRSSNVLRKSASTSSFASSSTRGHGSKNRGGTPTSSSSSSSPSNTRQQRHREASSSTSGGGNDSGGREIASKSRGRNSSSSAGGSGRQNNSRSQSPAMQVSFSRPDRSRKRSRY
ncbi:hypothetical protein BG004_002012 [Podila humilis]|nr:hypothetical protein BG004_002012 [Podila humilis]